MGLEGKLPYGETDVGEVGNFYIALHRVKRHGMTAARLYEPLMRGNEAFNPACG